MGARVPSLPQAVPTLARSEPSGYHQALGSPLCFLAEAIARFTGGG